MNSRISVTSTSTAVGEADAGHLDHRIVVGGEAHEDRDHDRARGGDDLARAGRRGGDRGAVARVAAPLLTHAREQEHVVVRREPEQDREHEQRHVGDDGLLLDAQQRRAGRGLERERHDAVGGRDRRQVEDGRQQRDPPRPEGREQEQQRQADDRGGEQRDAATRSWSPRRRSGRSGRRRRRSRRCRAARPGSCPARSRSTRLRVFSSCGPCWGVTVITAVSPFGLSVGAATSTTSRSAEMPLRRAGPAPRRPLPPGSETATTSGPLTPAPKPSASLS